MKVFQVLSQALLLSFVILAAHAQEEDTGRPPRPITEMRAEFEKKITALKEACATDIAALCSDAEGPHVIGCLRHNQESLTVDACKQAVAALPDRPHPPRGERKGVQ